MRYVYRNVKDKLIAAGVVGDAINFSRMDEIADPVLKRIQERLVALGKSERGASEQAGLSASTIRNIREGKSQSPKLDTIRKLAPVLETTPEWLAFGLTGVGTFGGTRHEADQDIASPPAAEPRASGPTLIQLRPVEARYAGRTQAGSFRPVEDFDDEEERPPLQVLPDREFPEQPLFWMDTEGDSMNALKPRPILPGDRLIAIDFEGLRGEIALRHDMVVVVEQTLDGGHHRERSVKQVEIYENEVWFCPRSTNPRHKPIKVPRTIFTDPSEDDGRQVRVLALVRSVQNDLTI